VLHGDVRDLAWAVKGFVWESHAGLEQVCTKSVFKMIGFFLFDAQKGHTIMVRDKEGMYMEKADMTLANEKASQGGRSDGPWALHWSCPGP
jgi:hypothetical protein